MNGLTRSVLPSAVLFLLIYLLRLAVADPDEGILFLMVIPISLLALEYKMIGGLLGAGVAAVAMMGWITINDVDLGAIGIATRTGCFALSGIGVSLLASQRDHRAERVRELEQKETRHQAALQVHEQILQNLAVAKMSLDMGDHERAGIALQEALRSAQSFVSAGVESEPGTLRAGQDL